MSRFWVSWWEPIEGEREDIEGVTEWQSGYRDVRKPTHRDEMQETSIVALIDAPDEHIARYLIESNRPVVEWRFRESVADDWLPGDRFPMPDKGVVQKDHLVQQYEG